MRRVMAQVERVAASETRVCILGETGTGKELIARTLLHERARARAGPSSRSNCAAVPAELIESRTFRPRKRRVHRRRYAPYRQVRAGAAAARCSWMKSATCRSVMQAKLLRVLEESEIERVGGDRPIPVDVRVVVATHRNLEELVKKGTFRQDLYHRIYVFPIAAAAAARASSTIFRRWWHTLPRRSRDQNGWKPKTFSAEAMSALQHYSWPGNVRELRNVVERLLLLSGETVDAATVEATLPQQAPGTVAITPSTGTLAERVDAFERDVLLAELKQHGYRMTETARVLGLERSHLYKKCQGLGIDLQAVKKAETDT